MPAYFSINASNAAVSSLYPAHRSATLQCIWAVVIRHAQDTEPLAVYFIIGNVLRICSKISCGQLSRLQIAGFDQLIQIDKIRAFPQMWRMTDTANLRIRSAPVAASASRSVLLLPENLQIYTLPLKKLRSHTETEGLRPALILRSFFSSAFSSIDLSYYLICFFVTIYVRSAGRTPFSSSFPSNIWLRLPQRPSIIS